MTEPRIEGPTPEGERSVEGASPAAPQPASPRRYEKLPTGPTPTGQTTSGPDADAGPVWEPSSTPDIEPVDDARLAPWALVAAIVALATSMFVGWGIPVALVSVMAAIMSLRRPVENREIATWALVLGLCATLFSAGWLIWATMQFETLG